MPESSEDLALLPLPIDTVGLLDGLTSTRAIRRFRDEAIPPEALRAMLFAATRAPSGSNRQPFRFITLTDGPLASATKGMIADAARRLWAAKEERDGYREGSGLDPSSPKARMAATMRYHVEHLDQVPALVLACLVRYREQTDSEGASIYPAVQNLLLAARAIGYGGVLTGWHDLVEGELRDLLGIPAEVAIAGTVLLGRPVGGHGPVRRRPLAELVYETWGQAPPWAVDPPGTKHTTAGPPS